MQEIESSQVVWDWCITCSNSEKASLSWVLPYITVTVPPSLSSLAIKEGDPGLQYHSYCEEKPNHLEEKIAYLHSFWLGITKSGS